MRGVFSDWPALDARSRGVEVFWLFKGRPADTTAIYAVIPLGRFFLCASCLDAKYEIKCLPLLTVANECDGILHYI